MAHPVAIGIDIGGTHLRAAWIDDAGTVHDFLQVRSEHASSEALKTQICEILNRFPPQLPAGVAIAGLVDQSGTLMTSPNLPKLTYPLPLQQLLTAQCGRHIVVGNDASYAAIAEHRFGAGSDVSSLLMVTLGTGVGAGIVLHDQLLLGHNGFAGEIGHMLLDALGASGGRAGDTVETYLSGTGIAARASQQRDGQPLRTEDVVGLAAAGDRDATALLNDTGRVLGVVLANVVNLLDVAVCVIGGGAGVGLYPQLHKTAADTMATHLLGGTAARQPPALRLAQLGDTAGVIGAAIMAAKQG